MALPSGNGLQRKTKVSARLNVWVTRQLIECTKKKGIKPIASFLRAQFNERPMNPHLRLLELRERFRPRLIVPRVADSAAQMVEAIEREELRAWRRDAMQYRQQRLAKIVTAGGDWPRRVSKKLRHVVGDAMSSPRLQHLALYEALGASGSKQAESRFARAHLLNVSAPDDRLNPRRPSREPIRLKAVPKANGGYRATFAYGPQMQSRFGLVTSVLRPLLRNFFRYQALERGLSRTAFVAEVSRHAIDPSFEVVLTADIRNFYGTVNPQYLQEFLPFPTDVIANTILQPLNRLGGENESLVIPEPMAEVILPRSHAQVPVSQSRRGVPQGASCSPLIAHAVLETIMNDLGTNAPIVQWADNLLIFGRSSREAADLLRHLEGCLAGHHLRGIPAGPLTLGQATISRIRDGFDFVGVNYKLHDGRIATKVTDESQGRFFDRLGERIAIDRVANDGMYNSAMEYVFYQWSPQAVTNDVANMQSRALSLINEAAERDGHET